MNKVKCSKCGEECRLIFATANLLNEKDIEYHYYCDNCKNEEIRKGEEIDLQKQ